MKLTILTLFPEILEGFFQNSIMKKSIERGLVQYEFVNIRDFALDKHKSCDDSPYGGGAGMVLKPEPLARALDSVGAQDKRTLYPSPSGRIYNQKMAHDLALEQELVFICGRYEGIDQRIIDHYVDDEISIGDYVISSGEVASLVIIDGVYRLLEGVITPESLQEESFSHSSLLEYPHYTRPEDFQGQKVPEVLLSGHHKNIDAWRLEQRREKTKRNRPDLWAKIGQDPQ